MEDTRGEGEIIFCEEDVIVFTPGPLKEEVAFSGKLIILNEAHGPVIEWLPSQQVVSSPKPSPDAENIDWGGFTVVGYKPKNDSNSESVEIRPAAKVPTPITFDISDLTSFRKNDVSRSNGVRKVVMSFYLKDGASIPALHFKKEDSFLNFFFALQKHVSIKGSRKDSSLYLINDPDTVAMAKSFSQLDLFDHEKPQTLRNIFQDPYILMGKFSKVANYWLFNGSDSPSGYGEDKVAEMLSETLSCIPIDHEESCYELITRYEIPPRGTVKREDPVTLDEWQSSMDSEGRILDVDHLKRRIFKGGLTNFVRSVGWKYLTGYYDYNSTHREQEIKRKQQVDYYYQMKLQWKTMTEDQVSRFSALRERRNLIEKDVSRTDRTHPFFEGDNNINIQMLHDILMTYCMFNFDLGYVQGMSDLLSPILVVMQDEADAFWCFSCWMEKMGANFEMEQLGMKTQLQSLGRLLHFVDCQLSAYLESHDSGNLYFAFRWLLILFKRDFKFQEVMRIWEVMWTNLPCKNFHLLICLAILDTEKIAIMENNYGLTEVLKHINDLAYKINLEETLAKAEAIYNQINNCSQVPDTIQTILGLEGKEKPSAKTPQNSEEAKSDESESNVDTPSNTSCSEDYVNIEDQFVLSFGLLS